MKNKVEVEGQLIDRSKVAYKLRQHKENDKVFIDSKDTVYIKCPDGSLRRWPPKVKKNKNKGV